LLFLAKIPKTVILNKTQKAVILNGVARSFIARGAVEGPAVDSLRQAISFVFSTFYPDLSQFQPLQLQMIGAKMRKLILRLLYQPAFCAPAKNFG
jgi:hypothetical protein